MGDEIPFQSSSSSIIRGGARPGTMDDPDVDPDVDPVVTSLVKRLMASNDSRLTVLALHRLPIVKKQLVAFTNANANAFSFIGISTSQLCRICRALRNNQTVTALELFWPHNDDDIKDDNDDDNNTNNSNTIQNSKVDDSACDILIPEPIKYMEESDVSVITDMLSQNQCLRRLTVLPFRNTTIATIPPSASFASSSQVSFCQAVVAGLLQSSSITHVVVEGEIAAPVEFAQFLAATRTLTRLTLTNFNTSDTKVFQYLAHGLQTNRSIHCLEWSTFPSTGTAESSMIQQTLLLALQGSTVLQELSIDDCDLSRLCHFPILPALQCLRLTECRLTVASLVAIATSFAATTTTPNQSTNAAPHIPSSLHRLDFRGTTVLQSTEACRILRHMIHSMNNLEKLVLEQCGLDDDGLEVLLEKTAEPHIDLVDKRQLRTVLPQLRQLSLRDNSLRTCNVLRYVSLPQLSELDVSDNRLGSTTTIMDSVVEGAASAIVVLLQRGSPNLRRLTLESCEWSCLDVTSLCRTIGGIHNQVRHLNLSYNPVIGTSAVSVIAEMLRRPSTTSSFSKVQADSCCMHDIRPLLLESLHLGSCGITDQGVAVIVDCLRGSVRNNDSKPSFPYLQLRELSLPWNKIGNIGVRTVASLIRQGQDTLQTLNLQFNKFDSKNGLSNLVNSLEHNCWLTDLQVSPMYGGSARVIQETMYHWLLLNRAGRRYATNPEHTTLSIWPHILVQADREYGIQAIYHMLRAAPHMMLCHNSQD